MSTLAKECGAKSQDGFTEARLAEFMPPSFDCQRKNITEPFKTVQCTITLDSHSDSPRYSAVKRMNNQIAIIVSAQVLLVLTLDFGTSDSGLTI